MAMKFRRGGKKKGTSVRLTGLFKTKRRGLYVGSMTELDELKSKVKEALAQDAGLVFFLWKNDPEEEGPLYTISVDVQSDDQRPSKKKRRPEPEDDDEPEDEDDSDSEDKDDEVPF